MNLATLRQKLSEHNVPERWYSLNEGLKTDAIILYKNYSKWECFYLDERGGRNDNITFYSDEEAYDYLWQKMEEQLKFYKK